MVYQQHAHAGQVPRLTANPAYLGKKLQGGQRAFLWPDQMETLPDVRTWEEVKTALDHTLKRRPRYLLLYLTGLVCPAPKDGLLQVPANAQGLRIPFQELFLMLAQMPTTQKLLLLDVQWPAQSKLSTDFNNWFQLHAPPTTYWVGNAFSPGNREFYDSFFYTRLTGEMATCLPGAEEDGGWIAAWYQQAVALFARQGTEAPMAVCTAEEVPEAQNFPSLPGKTATQPSPLLQQTAQKITEEESFIGYAKLDGDQLFDAMKFAEARKVYLRVQKIWGADEDLEHKLDFLENYFKGIEALEEKHWVAAIAFFQNALNRFTVPAVWQHLKPAYEQLAESYWQGQDFQHAKEAYQALLKKYPEDAFYAERVALCKKELGEGSPAVVPPAEVTEPQVAEELAISYRTLLSDREVLDYERDNYEKLHKAREKEWADQQAALVKERAEWLENARAERAALEALQQLLETEKEVLALQRHELLNEQQRVKAERERVEQEKNTLAEAANLEAQLRMEQQAMAADQSHYEEEISRLKAQLLAGEQAWESEKGLWEKEREVFKQEKAQWEKQQAHWQQEHANWEQARQNWEQEKTALQGTSQTDRQQFEATVAAFQQEKQQQEQEWEKMKQQLDLLKLSVTERQETVREERALLEKERLAFQEWAEGERKLIAQESARILANEKALFELQQEWEAETAQLEAKKAAWETEKSQREAENTLGYHRPAPGSMVPEEDIPLGKLLEDGPVVNDHAQEANPVKSTDEDKKWEIVARENTIAAYQVYLASTKEGKYTEEARNRIRQLRDRQLEQEEADWEAVKQQDHREAYAAFIRQYPVGRYIEAALARLQMFGTADQ